jgi:hypothetical protein
MRARVVYWPMLGVLCFALLGATLAGVAAVTKWQHRNGADPTLASLVDTILCIFVPDGAPAGFYMEIAAANAGMHRAMEVAPTGDPDRDFARMMIPHHQGAIDMALIELKYGRDERLRRLAQAIVVEQGQEIAYLRALLDPLPAAAGLDRITRQ